MLFLTNALNQWLNSSKSCDFGELQGFAPRINRFAVYSADINLYYRSVLMLTRPVTLVKRKFD